MTAASDPARREATLISAYLRWRLGRWSLT
jgi:hypothetical protein